MAKARNSPQGENDKGSTELEFQEIDATFRPKIHRYLTRLVGAQEAEDLTQEVLIKVNRGIATFRGESQLSTWIYKIATNIGIDKMRTPSYRQDAQKCSFSESNENDICHGWTGCETPLPEQELMRQDMYQCFWGFVNKLPLNYRTVYVLSEVEELTDKEIAAILGLSLGAVKIRLHRGKTKIMKELKAYCKAEDWL